MGESNYQKLPPGWDCKYDQATGNCYYINYFTKAMQLEDPRTRYKQLQNERCSTESIPLQHLHGSPYHVYPSNNLPAMRAFHVGPTANPSLQNMSDSPLLSTRGQLEMSPLPFVKASLTQMPRLANMSRRSTIQETSFLNQTDTDAVVTKIQNMFPTASEYHIRLLLKKYYNREAVVISALQVEKHPVTMPGPFVTPPAQRHLFHSNSAVYMTPPSRRLDIGATSRSIGMHSGSGAGGLIGLSSTSRTASPLPGGRFGSVMSMHSGRGGDIGSGVYGYPGVPFHGSPQWRSSPKPHSSPKMKLRYMKNIFPKADETLLLDILASADNNVQKASERLLSMGYVKRDFAPPKVSHRPNPDAFVKIIPLRPKEYTPEEKVAMQMRLKEKYPQIAERIIHMALDSVNYSEDRAVQILHIVQEEDESLAKKHLANLQTTVEQDETQVDAAIRGSGDNIITVVVETSTTTTQNNNHKNNDSQLDKKVQASRKIEASTCTLPSINITTPTTATTQIILSNSPICIDNEAQPNVVVEEIKDADVVPDSKTLQLNATKSRKTIEEAKTLGNVTAAKKLQHNNTTILSSPSSGATSSPSASSPSPLPSSFPLTASTSASSYQTITTKSILARSNTNTICVNGYLHGSSSFTSASMLEKLKFSRPRDKSVSLKNSQRSSVEEDVTNVQQKEFKSLLGRIAILGHNSELTKGPDEKLLLADYVTWNGANPNISMGHKQLAAGSDGTVLNERTYTPIGRNPELCKGPQVGLATGSIYAKLSAGSGKSTNIRCN